MRSITDVDSRCTSSRRAHQSATLTSSTLSPRTASARTTSRSLRMPASGGDAPVTTSAPTPRSLSIATASATERSGEMVATSRPLVIEHIDDLHGLPP